MSPSTSTWTAWALTPVLCAALTAAPANAEGCSGAAAQAQPSPAQAVQIPSPGKIAPFGRPAGHKPVGANDQAPLPNIGQMLAQALAQGLTVIVVSTDFEEVAHICHRALVFSRGAVVAEIVQEALTTEALIHAASASEAA